MLVQATAREFARRFDRDPGVVVAAPGRVNLMGGHVDYNDGIVWPMAIDRYTVIAGDLAGDYAPDFNRFRQATLHSLLADSPAVTISLQEPVSPVSGGGWANYPRGVLAGFLQEDMQVPGFDAIVASAVPIGGGLSSSAALTVAVATLLEALTGTRLDPVNKALICQQAEHDFAGVPCGIMDPFACVFGQQDHVLRLDCLTREVTLVPWNSRRVAVLILDTQTKHRLRDSEYALRRRQCLSVLQKTGHETFRELDVSELPLLRKQLDDTEFRRARHVITEMERCRHAADEILREDWAAVGRRLLECHESIRDDYEVSCPELDFLVDQAVRIGPEGGLYGMRMTGGGFGGCTVGLVDPDRVSGIVQELSEAFSRQFQRSLIPLVTRPSRGAHRVERFAV
jgi:galactokinase